MENVERIPAVLAEFIEKLVSDDSCDNQSIGESVFYCEDLTVRMIKGTPLNPPNSVRPNVLIAECGVDDEVRIISEPVKF